MNDLESSLVLLAATFGVAAITATVAWLRARERAIRAEVALGVGPRANPPRLDRRDAGQDARLEAAVEALAVDVERLAEGQRFVARVLTDRRPDGVAPTPRPEGGRVVTPH